MTGRLYHAAIACYTAAIYLLAPFHAKAKAWIKGRKSWKKVYSEIAAQITKPVIWVHVASLGEYEQAQPILQKIKAEKPQLFIWLTFFSPSGYDARKNSALADAVTYLPPDSAANARWFAHCLRPVAAIMVKYDFWWNMLAAVRQQGAKLMLISGVFRHNQYYFKPWAAFFRSRLSQFSLLSLQDEESREVLLKHLPALEAVSPVCGDTRLDRIISIAKEDYALDTIESFANRAPLLIAGSTWPIDEKMLLTWFTSPQAKDWKMIIAPHEVDAGHVARLANLFSAVSLQAWEKNPQGASRGLIVDRIGLLKHIYRLAKVAYIGGGFGRGIHNVAEAAVYGVPVLFGPNHHTFPEAKGLLAAGGAISINSPKQFSQALAKLNADPLAGTKASIYIQNHAGACEKTFRHLQLIFP